jgi:hypothetical protein
MPTFGRLVTDPDPVGSHSREEGGMAEHSPSRTFKRILPSIISLLVHGLVMVLLVFVPWAVSEGSSSVGLVIAATAIDDGMGEPIFNEVRPLTEVMEQPPDQPDTDDEWDDMAEDVLNDLIEQPVDSEETVISLRGQTGSVTPSAATPDRGIKIGQVSRGPRFFGQGAGESLAKKIVFVVDSSGSMILYLDRVKKELKSCVDRLTPLQSFHVIFFGANDSLENPQRKLVPAINVYKREAFEFLDSVVAEGRSDPTDAMKRAFEVEPDMVFFLSDGELSRDLLGKLDRWNKKRKVRIYTYAYVHRPGRLLLEEIAREHNGQFKFITWDEVMHDGR